MIDLLKTEDHGHFPGADPKAVSRRAFKRGKEQLGTLGSGNHFVEVDVVDKLFDPGVAEVFGLEPGRVCVLIHSGSRGFGHQICTDYIDTMISYMRREGLTLPDKQLACAHIRSSEAQAYLAGVFRGRKLRMDQQANYHALGKEAFYETFGITERELGSSLVYDVSHNIAKFEDHKINGGIKRICRSQKRGDARISQGA